MSAWPEQSTLVAPSEKSESAAARVVLFDFDGVLIRGDTYFEFLRARYLGSWWRLLILLFCLPWLLLMLLFSREHALRTVLHVALLGVNEQRYRRVAGEFAGALVRRSRPFCREALRALRAHQAAGDRVMVVTGCEQILMTAIFEQLGLMPLEVLASQLQPGWSGMRLRRHNVGIRKVQLLAQAGVTTWQVAYSDSLRDVPMLKPATQAVLVNATPKLCKKIEHALGRPVARVQWY